MLHGSESKWSYEVSELNDDDSNWSDSDVWDWSLQNVLIDFFSFGWFGFEERSVFRNMC